MSKNSQDVSALIQRVSSYCWSQGFINIFVKYFEDHADAFIDAPDHVTGGEHDMKYYQLYESYLLLYEDTLTAYLKSIDITVESFYKEIRDLQSEDIDYETSFFIECLLASTEYENFYRVMQREGNKHKHLESNYDTPRPNDDDNNHDSLNNVSLEESKNDSKAQDKYTNSSKNEGKHAK